MPQTKDIQEKVLWVIATHTSEKTGGGTDIRIVQWLIDGKPTKPALEKRDWYFDQQGDRKAGKAKGFSAFDVLTILKSLKGIVQYLEIPPGKIEEAIALAAFASEPPPTSTRPAASSPQNSRPLEDEFNRSGELAKRNAAKTPAGAIPDQQF